MTWRSWVPLLVLAVLTAVPQPEPTTQSDSSVNFRGGTLVEAANAVYAWGNGVYRIELPSMTRNQIAAGSFGEGGCTYDIDGDRILDVVLQSGQGLGNLIWISGRDGKSHTIDTGIDMHDCVVTTLLGRTGVLMIQRGIQVRFYSMPEKPGGEWGYTEIYSFYTPSYQTSLILADVDGDGLRDIFCGNYWMKSPEKFELPWHIFAINTYSETPKSAMVRLVLLDRDHLVAVQSHMADARLTIFEKPDDPRRLWIGNRLATNLHLVNPHGLVAWDDTIVVGENNGENSRSILLKVSRDGKVAGISRPSLPVIALWKWRDSLLELLPERVEILNLEDTRHRLESSPLAPGQTDRAPHFLPAPPPNAVRSGGSPASVRRRQ